MTTRTLAVLELRDFHSQGCLVIYDERNRNSKNFWENTQLAEPVELYCHLCVTLSGWKTYYYATEIQNMGEIKVVLGYSGKVFVQMVPKLGPCDCRVWMGAGQAIPGGKLDTS